MGTSSVLEIKEEQAAWLEGEVQAPGEGYTAEPMEWAG